MAPCNTALILGASGFIGPYLAAYLDSKNQAVTATYHRHLPKKYSFPAGTRFERCNVGIRSDLERVVSKIRPRYIYFLSAQSSVRISWLEPLETVKTNLLGALELLELLKRKQLQSRALFFSSGTIYGCPRHRGAFDEETCFLAKDPYSASKGAMDALARLYARVHGVQAMVVRLANLTGPGQGRAFSIANFAAQVHQEEKHPTQSLHRFRVGNLKAKRDFMDVRDAVRGMEMIMRRGKPGEAYNLGTGKSRSVGELFWRLIDLSHLDKRKVRFISDAKLMSKNEISQIRLNVSKLKRLGGFKPTITLDRTLSDILAYWRACD